MPRFVVLGFAACALALLSACGGGGSSSTPTADVGAAATTPASIATSPAANTPAASASAATSATPSAGGTTTLAIASPDDEKFDKKELTAPAGAKVTLTYTNDSDLAHNWHLFNGSDANARSLAQTKIITGPNEKDTITFTAPSKAGRYYFHCDVHPTTMKGFLVVK